MTWNNHIHDDDGTVEGCPGCFEVPVTVCVTHKRFVPCRRETGCVLSSREDDIEEVRIYQSGELSFPLTSDTLSCMPAVIPDHVARRNTFRDTTQAAWELNEHLETVTAIKSRGSSEVFHGKVDFSQPPWNTPAANQILDLHAWARDTEALWRLRAGLPARDRGGSSANTRTALEALTRLSEAVDDPTVQNADRQLSAWCKKARIVLGEAESARRLPRSHGEKEACCPWCKRNTLRQMALAGIVFCVDPGCTDEEGRRPRAQLEYFDNDWVLRWQDQVIGAP